MNTSTTRSTRRSAGARAALRRTALAGSALLIAATLSAQAFAGPFQQYRSTACNALSCKIDFPKVPAGKRLMVDSISCYARLEDSSTFAANIEFLQMLVLGVNAGDPPANALTMVPAFTSRLDDEVSYAANHTVTAFANAGQRFQALMQIDRGKFSQFACHISGKMTKV